VQRAGSDRGDRRLTQHGEDFYALREYQTGDDLRRVHWSSSARVDRLMIREEVDPAASRVALIGDLRRPVHTAASFERTLSVLASLADAAIRGNHSVRVTCSGGPDSGWGDGPAHTVAILDLLAAAQTSPPDAAVTLRRCIWERAQGASSVIVVTSDAIAAADLTTGDRPDTGGVIAVARSSEHRNDHREASVAAGPGLPWPVLSVAPGVPFGQIWARRSAAFR
jgi:uncharacterized protein (DUF58 family)